MQLRDYGTSKDLINYSHKLNAPPSFILKFVNKNNCVTWIKIKIRKSLTIATMESNLTLLNKFNIKIYIFFL